MSDLHTLRRPPTPPEAAPPGPELDHVGPPPSTVAPDALAPPPGFLSEPALDLPYPAPTTSWRDQLASLAGGLDLSLGRLLGGAALLAVMAVVGWRLLAPPPAPAEMQLPMADRTAITGDARGAPPGSAAAPAGPIVAPAADTGDVVVHVAGAVAHPGVRHLKAGSRVVDAVEAAGGAAPDADLGRLNLAAVLADGQQVYVVRTGEAPPTPLTPAGAGPGTGAAPGPPIDLNQATAEQLDALPGIGPATAAAIIATREERGRFGSVDDLLDVRGIGEAKLADLRARVRV